MAIFSVLEIACAVLLFFCAIGLLACEKERRRLERC